MYNSIKLKATYILLLTLLISCKKDFLEIVPKGNLIAATADDYQLLMNNNTFYSYGIQSGWHIPMLMGDELAAEGVYFNSTQPIVKRAFKWEPVIFDPLVNGTELREFLSNLYTCNAVINEVMSAEGSTAQKKSVLAQALVTRAWIYFQLINFYGKPYAAATAAQDPGFPIITKDDINQNSFDRSNVQAVHDFIVNDLLTAIPDLPIQNGVRTRVSKAAGEGLLGKVYLFMGKNAEALVQLNAAMGSIALQTNGPRLYDYNLEFGPGGSFLPIGNAGPAGPLTNTNDYTESVLFKTFPNFNSASYGNIGMVIKPEIAALFAPSDLRLKFYTNKNPNGSANPGDRLRKYVRYSRFGLELPDVYMLLAECKAKLNDLPGAVTILETFRNHRMPVADARVPAPVSTNRSALLRFIFDERIREYAEEGYRWFDMRRQSVDPDFSGQTFTHQVFAANGTTETFTLDQPNRLVMKIPQPIIDANSGMANNP
ncbi:RagB/SusD family nutrient uptake outer membrane protein [Pedobacter hiemivivus]|uniref:RagB/SusD family nutrient uptake outer membrane protein n=2 Tax=Pedobacter hiemivivus TaxID=2530454 RepID=A0A4R0NBP5_9SPHI|nr:RagB/SusD family nutrient uptake outer membrane protein [Pedobacter hiemivivus]